MMAKFGAPMSGQTAYLILSYSRTVICLRFPRLVVIPQYCET